MLIVKKSIRFNECIILLFALGVLLLIQSCHKKRSDLANTLYDKTRNKIFKKLDPQAFANAFDEELQGQSAKLKTFYQDTNRTCASVRSMERKYMK